MRFGFLVTARCNASCTHCTVSSGPRETTALPTAKILSLLDEMAAVWKKERSFAEPLSVCVSGGEPFLDYAQLLEVVRHGNALGARMSCVSNAFWATSDVKTRARLGELKRAGLKAIAFSTSRYHQQYVKVERVVRALRIAKALRIHTTLKCAVTRDDQDAPDSLAAWARSAGAHDLEIFPVMPYLRNGESLPESEFIRHPGLPRGKCPATNITVREDGSTYTCCQPGGFVAFLHLGNVYDVGMQEIYDRFYLQGQQQVLRHRGPIHFAKAIIAAGQGQRLRQSYESVCDLCAHIASDSQMAAIARDAATVFAEHRLRAAERLRGAA